MLITDAWGEPVELDELDAAGLLSVLEGDRLRGRGVERDKLRVAAQWCVLHPATADAGVACWDPSGLPGVLTEDESLGGEGTPAVAGFAAEPLGAALGVSTHAAKKLIADALDLQHRLPQIWKRVEVLAVEPWKARKVAELSHPLSRAAAADVDAALAPVLASCSFAAIERAVAHAVATHHPELVAAGTALAKDTWDVTLGHPRPDRFTGTSWLTATGDSLDLTAFYDRITQIAAELAEAGDEDPLGARRAKALGVLARQGVDGAEADLLSLIGTEPSVAEGALIGTEPSVAEGAGTAEAADTTPRRRRGLRGPRTHLYLHASLCDVLGLHPGQQLSCGDVERLGDVVLDRIRAWVGDSESTITPVLDLDREWAVDGHDAPEAMREQVILRDGHCVFPWCQAEARACDLDHIRSYVPMDEGGPPGQTNPDNLAPLCRRHHRCKTSGRWRYRRLPDGTFEWSGPHRRSYLVAPFGTIELHPN
ncbi:HNH endonuclease signature motif containing protein [Nocardioides panaciterrulae]|uniref:HNH nuclease domain-containing protein n=1 Tax=Nocardioides panaciterrulae TaxID=661492 RepID=A0A7Y9E6Z7_9ACTN|nr:HNH endonuclease signature motif containing protein [Nocardioides panaciterrulae]NYD42284.1 hypothetical protein [Nocardioides panaciterrulae]